MVETVLPMSGEERGEDCVYHVVDNAEKQVSIHGWRLLAPDAGTCRHVGWTDAIMAGLLERPILSLATDFQFLSRRGRECQESATEGIAYPRASNIYVSPWIPFQL